MKYGMKMKDNYW